MSEAGRYRSTRRKEAPLALACACCFPAAASDRKRGAAPERVRKYRQTHPVYRVLSKSVKRQTVMADRETRANVDAATTGSGWSRCFRFHQRSFISTSISFQLFPVDRSRLTRMPKPRNGGRVFRNIRRRSLNALSRCAPAELDTHPCHASRMRRELNSSDASATRFSECRS
jgi:hypothetical protein